MATMYAIPALTLWDSSNAGGWSNTSGGASNGTVPTSATDVIFDANSGPSRSIGTGTNAMCLTLNTTGANAMTFTASNGMTAHGNVNLTGSVSFDTLLAGTGVAINLTSGSATIGTLNMSGASLVTLQDDLVVTSSITLGSATSFNANNHNVTLPSLSYTGTATMTMGSGTWTMTGTGTVWNMGGTITVVPGTSTIKLTGNSASTITFNGNSKTYNNFWNATTGAGACHIAAGNTFNNVRINAGRTQTFGHSFGHTFASFTADGTGSPITIQTENPGTHAAFAKTGGGSIYLDYCSIKDIHATPSSTWNARNSTNVSNNTGITFIPGNSKFLQFL